MRTAVCLVFAGLMIGSSATIHAQGKFPPDKFVNLQIFPKNSPPDVVIAAMKNFTRALGVRCQFCHVGEEGMPLEKFDFASDVNPHKQIARMMIRMTGEINGQLTKAIPEAPAKGYQVTCFTCHRGAEHPQHSPDAPKAGAWQNEERRTKTSFFVLSSSRRCEAPRSGPSAAL